MISENEHRTMEVEDLRSGPVPLSELVSAGEGKEMAAFSGASVDAATASGSITEAKDL
jgi:hypothetical protein